MAREMGPLAGRTRTTLWVAPELLSAVKDAAENLGITQTAFFTLAAAQYTVELSPFLGPGIKRKDALKKMQKVFTGILDRAQEGL